MQFPILGEFNVEAPVIQTEGAGTVFKEIGR
jgi:hypothetical protein